MSSFNGVVSCLMSIFNGVVLRDCRNCCITYLAQHESESVHTMITVKGVQFPNCSLLQNLNMVNDEYAIMYLYAHCRSAAH
jgi:hypothetical protein